MTNQFVDQLLYEVAAKARRDFDQAFKAKLCECLARLVSDFDPLRIEEYASRGYYFVGRQAVEGGIF